MYKFLLKLYRRFADLKLSNRTIQFTPVKYLVPIAEKYPELKEQFEFARTNSEQMKKGLKEGLISQWYARQDSNLRPFAPQANALSS